MYVMDTKLTLRMNDSVIRHAKLEAKQRGKSVSQMFREFIDLLRSSPPKPDAMPPITASLAGLLKGHRVSEMDYKKHLLEKHL